MPFALLLIQRVVREDGVPLDAALGGSSGVIVIPLAVFGALFLLAWAIERQAPAAQNKRTPGTLASARPRPRRRGRPLPGPRRRPVSPLGASAGATPG